MIETLDKLTVAKFTDLICGDTSVLLSEGENAEPKTLAAAARNIIMEFREIADSSALRGYLMSVEDGMKAKISLTLFQICNNLITLHATARVREVLEEYGIDTSGMSDERVAVEVQTQLERAKAAWERFEADKAEENTVSDNIRRDFDVQTAALMAYFKFQIDTSIMKASVYAHLIARHNAELTAQLKALKK